MQSLNGSSITTPFTLSSFGISQDLVQVLSDSHFWKKLVTGLPKCGRSRFSFWKDNRRACFYLSPCSCRTQVYLTLTGTKSVLCKWGALRFHFSLFQKQTKFWPINTLLWYAVECRGVFLWRPEVNDLESCVDKYPPSTIWEITLTKTWEIEKVFHKMFSLKKKKKFSFRKSRSSLSSHGSVSDMEDRVVMLCEDVPSEVSFDSGQESISPGACSSSGSQSEDLEHGMGQRLSSLSKDGFSYRKVFVSETEVPWGQPCYLLTQRVHQP